MEKKQLTIEQKRLEADIWIISIITLGVFLFYATKGNQLMSFVRDSHISVIPRLLLIASIQFGIAGLGITIVCILRKEKFIQFGLMKKNLGKSIVGTVISFLPHICYIFASGKFNNYQPFSIMITDDVIASGIPFSILGMALIVVVWGFFEGFNYVVICEKINRRYPTKKQWLDYGAITCAIVCIVFHPFSTSFWGILEIITTFIAIYGMLIIRKKTGNAWGCVFAFCFIWNAL
ncbi:MAG: hypothetical protein E7231_09490 [Cellulosilyticum sp.]|nr:hypothetical protein [Cellulosilyticum sp.]